MTPTKTLSARKKDALRASKKLHADFTDLAIAVEHIREKRLDFLSAIENSDMKKIREALLTLAKHREGTR